MKCDAEFYSPFTANYMIHSLHTCFINMNSIYYCKSIFGHKSYD